MKVKKGNKTYPLITGNDIIVTKGSQALNTLDDALDNQQKEIDKLKSNMKYIYSYGGVGGNGSGSGSSSSSVSQSLVITLGNKSLSSDTETVTLGKTGDYTLSFRVRDNASGENSYLRIAYGDDPDIESAEKISLTSTNSYRGSRTLSLEDNGDLIIKWTDYNDDLMTNGLISCKYIVKTHTFDVKFKYKNTNGTSSEFYGDNEYFIGSSDVLDPYIEIYYRIDVSDISGTEISYTVSNTDISTVTDKNTVNCGSLNTKTIQIPLSSITKNGTDFLVNSNMGTYTTNVNFIYSTGGSSVTDSSTFTFTLIPNSLYIDVRNQENVMYDTIEDLLEAKKNGENGIPEKYILKGSYSSFYFTVYEGEMGLNPGTYGVTCKVYGYVNDGSESEDDEYKFTNLEYTSEKITVEEQVESTKPFEIPFSKSTGMKMIVFESTPSTDKGINIKNDTYKFVYIKEPEEKISDWSPVSNIRDYYFKANNGDDTYSSNFPVISEDKTPIELKVLNSSSLIVRDNEWDKMDNTQDTTILSLGIQYSKINSEGAKILSLYQSYNSSEPHTTLYSDRLFAESGEICIPYEGSEYNKSTQGNYHLIQIIRTKIADNTYASYFYIDGILESVNPNTGSGKMFIGKIELFNVNVCYNLINLQYLSKGDYKPDQLIYQYWLKYKNHMLKKEISTSEMKIFNTMNNIKFDGTNVIMSKSTVEDISRTMPIPSMMVNYTPTGNTTVEYFKKYLFQGYKNGDDGSFGEITLTENKENNEYALYWCDSTTGWHGISVPTFSNSLTANWTLSLQGTSTMRNRIKNFSLSLKSSGGSTDDVILVSPNYVENDYSTFLPEMEWTLKADIADSAHANNTSIGKFVNKVCTKFNTGETNQSQYIKNTLEGFPFLMYFKIGDEVYYLGVYNFNLGRSSYYNLGYYTTEDTNEMISHIQDQDTENFGPFRFSYGSGNVISTLCIGEIQDNQPQFGFNQYDSTVLFDNTTDTGKETKMFGKASKITHGGTLDAAQTNLQKFVKGIAYGGAYCFSQIGKEAIPSMTGVTSDSEVNADMSTYDGVSCEDKYGVVNHVPDIKYQMSYDVSDKISWKKMDTSVESLKNSPENLFKCILNSHPENTEETYIPILDYTSASEYYTICMAFAMADSVVKNMNIKSWNNQTNYIAFYDMDCALGEDNGGNEKISYLAAMDYWHSDELNNTLQKADVYWDYWNNSIGIGFDCKSSYLFAIVKYAQSLLSGYNINLTRFPQQFWAILRKNDGELRSADYFVNTYFKSGIGSVPAYMASLNYQVKYLYTGLPTASDDSSDNEKFLANASAFHGSRVFKVKDWLRKRIQLLDVMFNVQDISTPIYASGGITVPSAGSTYLQELRQNDDIGILQSAFSSYSGGNVALVSGTFSIKMKAPKNTPIIIIDGSSQYLYFLNKNIDEDNILSVKPLNNQAFQCLGSKELVQLNMVDPFLTSYYAIESDKLEEIIYGGGSSFPTTTSPFTITSTSVKTIKMEIPQYKAKLTITNNGLYGQALNELDIATSGFYGTWCNLKNLIKLNISSVSASTEDIKIYGCSLLTGNKFTISGSDDENLTTLHLLDISDVSGDFNLTNTSIEKITITCLDDKDSTFEINGDEKLEELTLNGFKEVKISNCPKLKSLVIGNTETDEICEKIIIDVPSNAIDSDGNPYLESFNSSREGVFDFRKYTKLETLGLTGCSGVEVIMIPDKKVSIDSFKDNVNLEFVDTPGYNSCIELTGPETFYGCPCYGMRQSWALDSNYGVYTRMCISSSCTSLASTFNKKQGGVTSKYLNPSKYTSSYYLKPNTNEYQSVYNKSINRSDVAYFLKTIVGGKELDDAYINENNYPVDTTGGVTKKYQDADYSSHITSLNQCFQYQDGVRYNTTDYKSDVPDLSKYTSLTDIAGMYRSTSVSYITSDLLSLPSGNNKPEMNLEWGEFVKNSGITISIDALKNISYRIGYLSDLVFTINGRGNSEDDVIDILDVLCPIEYKGEDGTEGVDWIWKDSNKTVKYKVNTKLTSFTSFNINGNQWVDYTRMFELCPNVSTLSYFLNCDLSKATIGGMLKNCTKLTSISDSFSHSGSVSDAPTIDLYNFFNWGKNTGMTNLFTSTTNENKSPGFIVNKTISYESFKTIVGLLHNYKSISSLTNIFSYCTIEDYDNESEIVLSGDMTNIKYLNALFYKCKGIKKSDDTHVPLNIRRSFFTHLPNVISLSNTFGYVEFKYMPTYDFFCKYKQNSNKTIYIGTDKTKAELKNYGYGDSITSMYMCFNNAKFYNNFCWFNETDTLNVSLKPNKDVVIVNNVENPDITTYYTAVGSIYTEYNISEPTAISDTKNNFTNYVESNVLGESTIANHSILTDLKQYGNTEQSATSISGVYTENTFNLYPVHCCLPPDIFYGCSNDCDLTGVFGNTNIMGVIPQHLLTKCYNGTLNNMFVNTDILPNVVYHYNKDLEDNSEYLTLIENIPVDETTITIPTSSTDTTIYTLKSGSDETATVLFRNGDGELRRRHPIVGGDGSDSDPDIIECSKSQFSYIPQGYTTNAILTKAFNFRYNLPKNVILDRTTVPSWTAGGYDSSYGNTYSPDGVYSNLWPYYTQYFFLTDESVEWKNITHMKYPFIQDNEDIDFGNGLYRQFSSNTEDNKNTWYSKRSSFSKGNWTELTNGTFNVLLDLCGKRDVRTGIYSDSGCFISTSFKSNSQIKLDSFVSGNLVTFLNGRIFDEGTDAGSFGAGNKEGLEIILFNTFAKNIILPNYIGLIYTEEKDPKVVLKTGTADVTQFYSFMFLSSIDKDNYVSRYLGESNENKYIVTEYSDNTIYKYKVL